MSEEINILANEEVDYAISMVPEFTKLYRNESIDRSHMGVQRESDFYLGAAWATATNFFTFDFGKRFQRPPNIQDNLVMATTLYERNSELREAISKLGIWYFPAHYDLFFACGTGVLLSENIGIIILGVGDGGFAEKS